MLIDPWTGTWDDRPDWDGPPLWQLLIVNTLIWGPLLWVARRAWRLVR